MDESVIVTRIQPAKGWVGIHFRELWHFRDLLYFLVWRDLKVRYKQTALGAAWAVIQPFFTMVVFSIFFGRLAGVPSDGIPYPLFAFAGLVPWTFFSNALSQSSNSLVGNQHLITKVYFPRLVIPVSAVLSGTLDFVIAFIVLLSMMIYYGVYPGIAVFTIPLFFLLALITALGTGLWLSALNVEFRDVRYIVPFLTQFWLFATPVAYPSSMLSEPWRTLYGLNPMVGVVEGFRWALLGKPVLSGSMLAISVITAFVLLVTGALYFRRMERTFADIV
ncbi:MAG TPA: ABC transporter permease [Acidobacteriota bacterium]|nr:ABC transporter permease [Acidobacteriota bacterium]